MMTSRLDRWRMRMHCHKLDRRLAVGEDPGGDLELEMRAAELTEGRRRVRLAAVLDRILVEAEGPARPFESKGALARNAIQDCAADVQAIVSRLDEGAPISPRGAAQVSLLVHDSDSPLYSPTVTAADLSARLREIADALGER